jgi:hypothetical protein
MPNVQKSKFQQMEENGMRKADAGFYVYILQLRIHWFPREEADLLLPWSMHCLPIIACLDGR